LAGIGSRKIEYSGYVAWAAVVHVPGAAHPDISANGYVRNLEIMAASAFVQNGVIGSGTYRNVGGARRGSGSHGQ
jgi:hypothetical protein